MATYDLAYPGAAIDAILNTAYFLQEAGYIFQGSASEYSGTPSKRVWLIAPAGFTGLGLSSAVPQGSIGICLYNGTAWVGKVINVVTLDSGPTRNSQNGVTSGGVAATLDEIAGGIMATFASLLFDDETAAGDLRTKLSYAVKFSVSDVYETVTHLNILAATTSKAGLMSAEDKAKVDSFLANLRSLTFDDTTASADQGTKITETLKATIGGVQEVIDSITLLAATSSKAGLLSAADKAYIDALPATLTNLSNSISGALALMQSLVGYYVCDTAAGTAAKTVAAIGYSLTNGGCIRIKMTNSNTADNATLNINSTGAKALYYDGAQASSTNTWEAGEVLEVYYDGTQYQCASGGGGKFATGEAVKDTSIVQVLGNSRTSIPSQAAVNNALENINDIIFGDSKTIDVSDWPTGFYSNASGNVQASNNFVHTPSPILLKKGNTIKITSGGYGYYLLLQTNLEMSSISSLIYVQSAHTSPYTYKATEDIYVLVSLTISGGQIEIEGQKGVEERLEDLEDDVFGIKSTMSYTEQNQGYINTSGVAVTTTSNYRYTNLIDVSRKSKLVISKYYASASTLAIAAYADGTSEQQLSDQIAIVGSSVAGSGTSEAQVYIIPNGVKYIRLTYDVRFDLPEITAYSETAISKLEHEVDNDDDRISILEENKMTTVVELVGEYEGGCFYNGSLVTTITNTMCRKYDVSGIGNILVTSEFYASSTGFYFAIFTDASGNVLSQEYPIVGGSVVVSITDEPINVPSGAKYVYLNSRGNTSLPTTMTYYRIDERAILQSSKKSISVLFVGNSLTQDAVSYVPLLMQELAPSVDFKFYIFYNGGKTLSQQYTIITNNTACETYSECVNTYSWTNYSSSKTMADVISSIEFDILCLQEYYNYAAQDISAYNNIVEWFMTNYSKPFKLVTLFHAPLRSDATVVFNRTLNGIENILKSTPTEGLIPAGIAIYRALSTELNSLGDQGGLSPDGTHAQEGLPCTMEAYVTCLWIFRELAIPMSVLRSRTVVNRDNYLTINVPGPNYGTGCVVGTDAEVRLSQQIAVKAWKEGEKIVNSNLTP